MISCLSPTKQKQTSKVNCYAPKVKKSLRLCYAKQVFVHTSAWRHYPPTGIMGGLGLKGAAVVGLAYHSTPAATVIAAGIVAVMTGVTIFMVKAVNREEKILDALKTL